MYFVYIIKLIHWLGYSQGVCGKVLPVWMYAAFPSGCPCDLLCMQISCRYKVLFHSQNYGLRFFEVRHADIAPEDLCYTTTFNKFFLLSFFLLIYFRHVNKFLHFVSITYSQSLTPT